MLEMEKFFHLFISNSVAIYFVDQCKKWIEEKQLTAVITKSNKNNLENFFKTNYIFTNWHLASCQLLLQTWLDYNDADSWLGFWKGAVENFWFSRKQLVSRKKHHCKNNRWQNWFKIIVKIGIWNVSLTWICQI